MRVAAQLSLDGEHRARRGGTPHDAALPSTPGVHPRAQPHPAPLRPKAAERSTTHKSERYGSVVPPPLLPLACEVGAAPGYWGGARSLDWALHPTEQCPVALHAFVRVEPSACGAKATGKSGLPTNLPTCVVQDRAQLEALRNGSILMLGDSTSAQLLMHACDAFASKALSFVANASYFETLPNATKYRHRLRSMDNHACRLLGRRNGLGLPIGSFSHYGATGPPYWAYAYPLAPWLGSTSVEQVERDAPSFSQRFVEGAPPDVVVVGSGFWDIAAWWLHEGNTSRSWEAGPSYIPRYVRGVDGLLTATRRTFPHSKIVWRTMHPGFKHSITPSVVAMLNEAVRAKSKDWQVPLFDVARMVDQLPKSTHPVPLPKERGSPYGTVDGRHLHEWLNIGLLNVLLNLLSQTLRHRPSPTLA
ncbi:hypothetical protein AB1Y20_016931 [Prymnesium parvum]|uniref:SGNH hydrolase-type esterase domain-containing protein n=1 Tax=Prymnesium parvum TaxID=97485 RepID=A0AB34IBL1_PRYPA